MRVTSSLKRTHFIVRQSSSLLALLALLSVSPVSAQVGMVTPVPNMQWLDASGNPLAAGTVTTYQCGTTTLRSTYTTSALSVANSNPTTLDGAGRAPMYLTQACYKFLVKNSAGTTIYTQDNVYPGIPMPTSGTASSSTYLRGDYSWAALSTPTSIAATSGSVSAPSVAVGNTTTGLYSAASNELDFTTNSTKALSIDSTQFIDSPTQPRASAYASSTQSISNSTATAVTFDSEDYDVGSMHSTVSNTSRITIPTSGDGLYLVIGQLAYAANATGIRQTLLRKNGTTGIAQDLSTPNGTNGTEIHLMSVVTLVATDYVELVAVQSSGGALNVGSASGRETQSALQVVKLW